MKKLLVVAIMLLAGVVFAQQTQDLGSASKKEKERREAIEKSNKKAKTYTKEDIERVKDKLAIESKTPADDTTAAEPTASGAEPGTATAEEKPATPEDAEKQKEEQKKAETENQKRELQAQLDELHHQKDDLQAEIDENRKTLNDSGNGAISANPAIHYSQMDTASAKMDELNKKIAELEQKMNDLEPKK